jgi:lysozyme
MTVGDFLRAIFGGTKAMASPVKKAGPAAAVVVATAIAVATPFVSEWEGFTNPKVEEGEVLSVAIQQNFDPPGVITYCQGLTNYDNKAVKVGQKFTKTECNALFAKALERYYGYLKRQVPTIVEYPATFQASQLSIIYNIGEGNYSRSSMKKAIINDQPKVACEKMKLYVKANGKVLRGLVNRRTAEYKLCMKDLK